MLRKLLVEVEEIINLVKHVGEWLLLCLVVKLLVEQFAQSVIGRGKEKNMMVNVRLKKLESEQLVETIGGMKCYSNQCIRRRARSAGNAYDYARGFAHGVCQASGFCG